MAFACLPELASPLLFCPELDVKRALLLIPIVSLVMVATWSIIGQATFLRDSTSPDDWERAARHITSELIPKHPEHSKIMVWPVWRETPLPHMVDVHESLLWQHAPLLEDLQNTKQLIIISPADRTKDALDALPFLPTETESKLFDSVSVLQIDMPIATQWPGPSLAALLPKAKVSLRDTQKTTPCTWRTSKRSPGWHCKGHPRPIAVSEYELDDQPRRCIMAHAPPKASQTLSLAFPTFPSPPSDGVLRVRSGFDLRGARLAKKNDRLTMTILDAKEPLGKRSVNAFDSSWEALDIPVKKGQDLSALRIEISAPTSKHKLFCVNGWFIPQ